MTKTATRTSRSATIASCVSLAALGLAACGGTDNDAAPKSAKTLKVTLTDQGCSPARLTAPAGPLTVSVANGGTSAVTEMELKDSDGIILGERENVAAGVSGSFTLNVKPGRYVMSCPNGDKEDNGVLLVTGTASTSSGTAATNPLLAKALEATAHT